MVVNLMNSDFKTLTKLLIVSVVEKFVHSAHAESSPVHTSKKTALP